jgi:xyloglucan-specific exo-beta-1,4-glucanase
MLGSFFGGHPAMLRFAFRFRFLALAAISGCGSVTGQHPDAGPDQTGEDGGAVVDASVGMEPADAMIPGTTACPARGPAQMAPPDTADTTPVASPGAPYLWRNVAIVAGGFMSGIIFSPAQQDIVYARADIGGAYRWNAAAKRWIPLLDWVSRDVANWAGVESIAPDPQDANTVYIAAGTYTTTPGVILRSRNRGDTFDQTTMTTIPMGGNADGRSVGERLAVDPNNASTLYFGSRLSGLWKSTDAAAHFAQVTLPSLSIQDAGPGNGGLSTGNGVGISFVQFDPSTCGDGGNSVVYVGVATAGPSLFRSVDGGATFTAVPNQPQSLLPSHAALGSTGQLFVTYGGGAGTAGSGPNNVTTGAVFRLNTKNDTWTDVTPLTPNGAFGYAGVSVDASNPQIVVVSTIDRWSVGDDIFRSTDGGAHWAAVGVPRAPHDISPGPWVTFHQAAPNYTGWMGDVEIDPFNSSRVLHITGQGIWATDNINAMDSNQVPSWDFRSAGIEETAVLDLQSPQAGPHLFSGVGDIGGFVHDDLDVSPPGGMSTNPVFSATDGIDFAGMNPTVVARIGRGAAATSPHGAFSTDGGATWKPFPTTLAIANNTAGSIAVSADGTAFVWDTQTGGPQVSLDMGMTWTRSGGGIGAIRPVVADRVNPNKFYAFDRGTAGVAPRMWVSTDRGVTFAVAAATGLPTGNGRARATPGIEGDLWVQGGNGALAHSTDSGATFTAVTTVTGVYAMGFGMAAPGQTYPAIFVGGSISGFAAMYRSDDAGATWVRVDDNQHRFGTGTVIAGDPRVYGRLYVGTNGRGVFYGDMVSTAQ